MGCLLLERDGSGWCPGSPVVNGRCAKARSSAAQEERQRACRPCSAGHDAADKAAPSDGAADTAEQAIRCDAKHGVGAGRHAGNASHPAPDWRQLDFDRPHRDLLRRFGPRPLKQLVNPSRHLGRVGKRVRRRYGIQHGRLPHALICTMGRSLGRGARHSSMPPAVCSFRQETEYRYPGRGRPRRSMVRCATFPSPRRGAKVTDPGRRGWL